MGAIADRFRAKQLTGRMPASRHQAAATIARSALGAVVHQEASREALKGTYLGNCNRTACQAPGAVWWNFGSRSWYCRDCAILLNRENAKWVKQDIGRDVLCEDRGIYATDMPRLLPNSDGTWQEAGE